jgi:hypothetical protein
MSGRGNNWFTAGSVRSLDEQARKESETSSSSSAAGVKHSGVAVSDTFMAKMTLDEQHRGLLENIPVYSPMDTLSYSGNELRTRRLRFI